jgi:cell division protein FtsA
MDVRIGFPNEHLAGGTPEELASPMFATGIGLVIEGIHRHEREEEMDRIKNLNVAKPGTTEKEQKKPVKSRPSYLEIIKGMFDRELLE